MLVMCLVHWSERRWATSFAEASAGDRLRRSVLSLARDMTTVGNKRTITAVAAFVVLAISGFCWFLFAGPRIKILNPRFQVLDVRFSRGTNHWIYDGNQLEGRMRYFLRGLGLPVNVPQRNGGHTQKDVWSFIVRCSGDFEAKELVHLRADLIDAQGSVTPLRWTSGYHKSGRPDYLDFWVLDSWPADGRRYRLRRRLPTEDVDLAEIDVGKL